MLTFYDKVFRLTDLASRNERVKTNAVHISLNFAVGEVFEKDKLNEITGEYIGSVKFIGDNFPPESGINCKPWPPSKLHSD